MLIPYEPQRPTSATTSRTPFGSLPRGNLERKEDTRNSTEYTSPILLELERAQRQDSPYFDASNQHASSFSLQSRDVPSTPTRKRNIIDLTSEDEEAVPITRKKSRSSSQSTEVSGENQISESGKITKPNFKPATTKPERSQARANYPGKQASAVLVPPPQPSPRECREQFKNNLRALGQGVFCFNGEDDSSPSPSFRFVKESILGPGVTRTTEDFMSGCKCRKENGRSIGCEYLSCECLGESATTPDGKRVFPYAAGKNDFGCLRQFYLNSRHHIYECNNMCNCESNCKNRVVQHGRTVPLQIFKTPDSRGWGLRCMQDLKRGQFIDTYRGEIITHEEANARGDHRNVDQGIYLMDFDKWTEDEGAAQYVCDGMHVGGPTRFINHSCDPNCGIYTVSYNHADISIYELAFFATEAIPAFTELTFDYVGDEDRTPISEEKADQMEKENGYRPARCLCGTKACRSKKRNPTDQMNVFVEPGQVMDDFSRAIFSERDSMSTVELHEI